MNAENNEATPVTPVDLLDYNINVQFSKAEINVILKSLHFIWNHRADIAELPDTDIFYNLSITQKLVLAALESAKDDDKEDAMALRSTVAHIVMSLQEESEKQLSAEQAENTSH